MVKLEESLVVVKKKPHRAIKKTQLINEAIEVFPIEEIGLEDIVISTSDPTQDEKTQGEIDRFYRQLQEKRREISAVEENLQRKQRELINFALEMAKEYKGEFISEFEAELAQKGMGSMLANWDGSEQYIRDGQTMFYAKNYEAAIQQYKTALEVGGFDIRALKGLGKLYRKINKPKEALGAYDMILKHQPNSILAKINKGLVLRDMKKYMDSLDILREVIQADKYNTIAWTERAETLRQFALTKIRKRNKKKLLNIALEHITTSIELEPLSPKAWFVHGDIYYAMGEMNKAFKCYSSYEKVMVYNNGKK